MPYFVFILKSALFDFSRNKLRTFLTSLGILIGVFAVVILVAMGLGLKKYIEQQFESLGTNILRVIPGKVLEAGGFRAGPSLLGGVRFDDRDVTQLKKIKGVEYVMPLFTKSVNVATPGKQELADIYASSSDFFLGLNFRPEFGRVYSETEVEKRSKVAVVGPKIAQKLFVKQELALDKIIKIEGQSFRVIGVLEAKGGGFGGPDIDSMVHIPYTSAQVFNPDKKFVAIALKTESDADLNNLKTDITKSLLKRYKEEEFSVVEQSELISAIFSIFSIINLVLVAIAAISLLVGGIGIMNIMFVSVSERIREIGIRRAVGARRVDILSQFLLEAVILSAAGGFLGLILAFLATLALQRFFPAYINWQSVLLALGVSGAIGIIFGVIPAKRAADLSPIEAIRYE